VEPSRGGKLRGRCRQAKRVRDRGLVCNRHPINAAHADSEAVWGQDAGCRVVQTCRYGSVSSSLPCMYSLSVQLMDPLTLMFIDVWILLTHSAMNNGRKGRRYLSSVAL